MGESISLRPSEMVEGGAVPVDQNLTIKEARFCLYDYNGKAPMTTAGRLNLVNDEGVEYTQYYSVGDPERFKPSDDGKRLVAVGAAQAVSKSSNFFILANEAVNAGFPENKIGDDITAFEGLYAFWIGLPEPKRSGLVKAPVVEGQTVREKVVLVPSKIHKLPWEKKAAGAKATAGKPPVGMKEEEEPGDVTADAVEFIGKVVADGGGSATRQEVAVRAFKDLANDPNRDAIAAAIYAPITQAALIADGFKVEGETISKQ